MLSLLRSHAMRRAVQIYPPKDIYTCILLPGYIYNLHIYTTTAPHYNVSCLGRGLGHKKICMSRKYLQVILNALGNIEVNGKHVPRRLSWTSGKGQYAIHSRAV